MQRWSLHSPRKQILQASACTECVYQEAEDSGARGRYREMSRACWRGARLQDLFKELARLLRRALHSRKRRAVHAAQTAASVISTEYSGVSAVVGKTKIV